MKRKHTKQVFAVLLVVVISGIAAYFYVGETSAAAALSADLPLYTRADLHQYDGTVSSSKILIGYEGAVYDVTAGRTFYEPGGEYHDLAGTDATVKLHYFGGGIIARKYPVVGRLAP